MGGAIRIGHWCIGLDPLPGLLPGPGDLIGVSDLDGSIVVRAVQAGIPRIAVARMMAIITIDTRDRLHTIVPRRFRFRVRQ
jgi:hypothetical protein